MAPQLVPPSEGTAAEVRTAPTPVMKDKQLVVEGRSAYYFFIALLKRMRKTDVQVRDFGGVDDLPGYLETLTRMSGFAQVIALGIVRDAEQDAGSAFQSVSDSLKRLDLPAPSAPEQFTESRLKVGVLILPDGKSPEMLEDLCLSSVSDDAAIPCVDQYLDCLRSVRSLPRNLSKGRIQAFLASRPKAGLLLGEAASNEYWPWDHPAFDHVKRFLQAM